MKFDSISSNPESHYLYSLEEVMYLCSVSSSVQAAITIS